MVVASLFVAAALSTPTKTVVGADDRFAPLRRDLMAAVAQQQLPSVSIAVISGDRLLWEESIGWADREHSVAATPSTPYLVASLGKSVTATALMRFVERGQLSLDAPVEQ